MIRRKNYNCKPLFILEADEQLYQQVRSTTHGVLEDSDFWMPANADFAYDCLAQYIDQMHSVLPDLRNGRVFETRFSYWRLAKANRPDIVWY